MKPIMTILVLFYSTFLFGQNNSYLTKPDSLKTFTPQDSSFLKLDSLLLKNFQLKIPDSTLTKLRLTESNYNDLMPYVRPNKSIDYKILTHKADSTIDYKILEKKFDLRIKEKKNKPLQKRIK